VLPFIIIFLEMDVILRHARLPARARADRARLAYFADAPHLSSDAQLLHLESDPARHQRRMGQLGKLERNRQRARRALRARLASDACSQWRTFQSTGLFIA